MNKITLSAAIAVLAATIPATASAQRLSAQPIAVVDSDRIFRECTACRAAQTQLQTQLQQAQQRAQQLTAPLQTEGQAIQKAVSALNGRQPDAALTARIQALQTQQNTANQELSGRETTLRSTQQHVQQQIGARLGPIINTVMGTRGAAIVVDRSATLAVSPTLDITNDVLAQLNQQLPSVNVTPLPQQQQQQTAPRGR
jgi:Skp family chaperone for outer membrane proteins